MGRKARVKSDQMYLRILVLLLAVLALSVSQFTTRAARDDSSLVSTATVEGRLAVFDDVWETIQERYYDPKFHGIDWHAKRIAFRPAAGRASSTHELPSWLQRSQR